MGLDSITQTLSNSDCGLSKPHIPDNTPYISHRLIHSNRQGPHPQIYHMTCLSFSLTMAAICLPFFPEKFTIAARTSLAQIALSIAICVSHLSFIFALFVVSNNSGCSFVIANTSIHSHFLSFSSPTAITPYTSIFIVVCNSKLLRTSDNLMQSGDSSGGLFLHLYTPSIHL